MPYSTNAISHSSQYNFNVTMGGGGGTWTCTTIWTKSNGAVSSETITANGNRSTPAGATRMVFIVNSSPGSSGTFTITQTGVTLLTCNFTEGVEITFDVT